MPEINRTLTFEQHQTGQRLDQALAQTWADLSRERIKAWIKSGAILVNGQQAKPRDKVQGHETVALHAELETQTAAQAEPIALDIVHEDDVILVINKPAGLVVHPGAGNPSGTLLNALLAHQPALGTVPRAGIVHRIDKDTSGLLVIAKNLATHKFLVDALKEHTIQRSYEALCYGELISGGSIDAPIGRHPRQRTKMAVIDSGKPARTHYRVLKRLKGLTHIKLDLETGRTHQIRVHMAHIGHPLVGDPLYRGRLKLPKGLNEAQRSALQGFKRQALHARELQLTHPSLGTHCHYQAPLAADLGMLLQYFED